LAGDLVFRFTGKGTGIDSYSVERLTGSLAVDSSLLRETTGWRPPFTMDEGLALTLRYED
jgi:nucleoside-diphosphate-sugar epimerase